MTNILLSLPRLLLPAVVPSWNFLDYIVPSPRIEFALFNADASISQEWREFQPRPKNLPVSQMLKRMLWNPSWNENLFLMSCAERLMANPTAHSEDEIFRRIHASLQAESTLSTTSMFVQFRLHYVRREADELKRDVCFISAMQPLVDTGVK